MARGSFPYVVLATAVTLAMASFLWGLIDYELVRRFTETNIWQDGIASAVLVRHWVILAWDAFLPVVLLGCGMQLLISSRLNATSGGLIRRTFLLWVFDTFMVVWGFVFPKLLSETFQVTQRSEVHGAMDSTNMWGAITFLRDVSFAYGPALLMVAAGLYYLYAPIRNDILARGGFA